MAPITPAASIAKTHQTARACPYWILPTRCPRIGVGFRLSTTIDHLAFDPHEREPADNLKLAFEATQHLTQEEQAVVLQLIEAMLLKHEARRWAS